MNPWKRLYSEFKALTDDEARIVPEPGSLDRCFAYLTYGESGESFEWWVENIPNESLEARFELLATEGGVALGSPPGTVPQTYWLQSLFLDLRANGSRHIRVYSNTSCFIDRMFEASTDYCARLDRRVLEKAAMACEEPRLERNAAILHNEDDASRETQSIIVTAPPRRTPDLEKSRQRLAFCDLLTTELATIKQDLKGYCTAESLKKKYPGFVLWKRLSKTELEEIVRGDAFVPKMFAESLTLRKFGITSRESLKKDRQKIKRAERAVKI